MNIRPLPVALSVFMLAAIYRPPALLAMEVPMGEEGAPATITANPDPTLTPELAEFFERSIRPLLVEHCYECHSAGANELQGGLLLDSRAGVHGGGDSGPTIIPGDPDASLLIQAVRQTDPNFAMPPDKKLAPEEIAALEQWVKLGAPDPRIEDTHAALKADDTINWTKAREWWSFRPLVAAKAPEVQRTSWPANEVDNFILARNEHAGLEPAAGAEKRTLIRRATFDLIGLPPTPAEVEEFLSDDSPDAFTRIVNRLLESPHYGERWGRHWLDVVRYADTAGDNSDFPIPQMYRYRNWVIGAFNRDLPYDQFVREQIAGDLLSGANDQEMQERLIATGYIANARRFGSTVDDYPQHLTIEDTIDNLGRAFLGLTINCARCHDHKFDPITSADYYALYGIFHSTRYPWPGIELEQKQRDLVPLVAPEQIAEAEAVRTAVETEKRRLGQAVQELKDSVKNTPAEKREDVESRIKDAERALEDLMSQPLPFEMAYAVSDAQKIEDVAIQLKGNPAKTGETVRRGFLTVLGGAEVPPSDLTSGRRQLAEWIVDPNNPLITRVMVNRIWLHHFGKGLVSTPNDFGKQGMPPTHPELLDWLATKFIESGWSVKSMHRLIMCSRTYQLASRRSDDAIARDVNNELLSSFPRRRIDAETIRDALLVLGGNLDTTPAGPHPFPPESEWKFTQHNPFRAVYATERRSVYLMTQRIQRDPFLAIFDGSDPAASTPIRTTSTTPLQALYLLNDAFVHKQSALFAARLLKEAAGDDTRLNLAYQACFARPPDPEESDDAGEFLAHVRARLMSDGIPAEQVHAESWQALVRVLFRLNEFVYVD